MIGATIEPLDEQFGKKGAIKEWWLSRKFAKRKSQEGGSETVFGIAICKKCKENGAYG